MSNSSTVRIRDLKVERIGHGVRSGEDPDLLRLLLDRKMPLEMCPSSNVALGLFPSLAAHPVKRFAEQGLQVTISTDDPPFMHTDIRAEYEGVARAHALTPTDMLGFTQRSIAAAFCNEPTKQALRARLSSWERTSPTS